MNQYRNKKTGNVYFVLTEFINSTNAQAGQEMILFFDSTGIYGREKKEFFEKFEELKK